MFQLFRTASKSNRTSSPARRNPKKRRELRFEGLEQRQLLTTFRWDGDGGDTSWATAANSRDNVVPVSADTVEFPATVAENLRTVTVPSARGVGKITIAASGYTISGSALTLGSSGIEATYTGSNSSTVSAPLVLNVASTSIKAAAGGTLRLTGVISGASGKNLTYNSGTTGTIYVSGNNTYSGTTTLSGGWLQVGHNMALGAYGSATTVSNGATLFLPGGITLPEELKLDSGATLEAYGTNTATGQITLNRYMLDYTGQALVNNLVDWSSQRSDPEDIIDYLMACGDALLDVDLDGVQDAATDGAVIMRYVLDYSGTPLVSGLGLDPRDDPTEIELFLDSWRP